MEYLRPQRGAIPSIFQGSSPLEFQPLVEVRNVRKLQQDAETRYAVQVTDGEWVVKALAIPGSTLIQQVESGSVAVNTLIKAVDYRLEDLNGTSFLLIMKADIVGMVPQEFRVSADQLQKWGGGRTGVGAGFTQADPAAAAAAQAQAQAAQAQAAQGYAAPQLPPWSAQPSSFQTPERRANTGIADQTPMPQPMGMRAAAGQGANPYGGAAPMSGLPPQCGNGFAGGASAGPPYGAGAANNGRQGTMNDFFGRQPVANKPSGGAQGGFLPIAELSPYTNGRWKIKARVVTKSDIRRFNNARGEGQLFKIDLADATGEISATFFGKAVDAFYPQLRQGQVYSFSRGHIKQGNPRWDRSEHVLTFEEQAAIEALEDDRELPGVSYNFKPICNVPEMEVNSNIDVQAVIYAVQEPFTFTSKNTNKEMVKREVGLWDPSGPEGASFCTMTLWGDKALNETFELGAPVFIKGARVTEWNNEKSLASPGVLEQNPDDPRAFALKAKFEEHQKTRPLPITMTKMSASSAGTRKTIRGCREEDLNLGQPPAMGMGFDPNGPRAIHRHYVLATVTSIPSERMPCYPSCPGLVDSSRSTGATQGGAPEKRTCNKKVTNEGPGIWRCAAGHVCQQPVYRYLAKMQVMDHTDSLEVNVYDNVARQFFGCEAGEYAQMYENPEQDVQLQQTNRRVLWRRVMLKLRSQKEVWQETERVRYNVDDASGVTLVREAKSMLAEVKGALAA
uniref:Replication protein A subunit n=1 Tax=Alexandrium catenella TaxID=2925 RepID=A0A7S1S7A1_ALECA